MCVIQIDEGIVNQHQDIQIDVSSFEQSTYYAGDSCITVTTFNFSQNNAASGFLLGHVRQQNEKTLVLYFIGQMRKYVFQVGFLWPMSAVFQLQLLQAIRPHGAIKAKHFLVNLLNFLTQSNSVIC